MELVLQEVLLPLLSQLALRVRSAVAEELFRITITRLRQKTSLLEMIKLKDHHHYDYIRIGILFVQPKNR